MQHIYIPHTDTVEPYLRGVPHARVADQDPVREAVHQNGLHHLQPPLLRHSPAAGEHRAGPATAAARAAATAGHLLLLLALPGGRLQGVREAEQGGPGDGEGGGLLILVRNW